MLCFWSISDAANSNGCNDTPNPRLLMPSPGGFGLCFGQQMFTPGGFGQQMFYGQMASTLFSPEVISFLVLIILLLLMLFFGFFMML